MSLLEKIRGMIGAGDGAANEQLDFLIKSCDAQLQLMDAAYLQRVTNKAAYQGEILPKLIIHGFDYRRFNVNSNSTNAIQPIIDSCFSGSGNDIRQGLSNAVTYIFGSILGSSEAGESNIKQWFITVEYGALIRVDLMAWRYNFSQQSFLQGKVNNAYAFWVKKAFADTSTLNKVQIRYFVAQSLGITDLTKIENDPTLNQYVNTILAAWDESKPLQDAIDEYRRAGVQI